MDDSAVLFKKTGCLVQNYPVIEAFKLIVRRVSRKVDLINSTKGAVRDNLTISSVSVRYERIRCR